MKGKIVKMNIKRAKARILSVILAIMTIPKISFAFPSVLDDVPEKNMMVVESTAGEFSDDNVYRAFKILTYIGIISEKEDSFEENTPVSRGYAATAFAALASGAKTNGKVTSFVDVPEKNIYAAGIQQAADIGIIDIDTDRFYPNKNVTQEDIAEWALRALKRNYIVYNKSMLSAASEIGIFKGVSLTDDSITMGQFMLILENVLLSDFVEISITEGGNNVSFDVVNGENYLNNKYDIYLQEGILTGYKYSSIYGELDIEADKVLINRAPFYIDEQVPMEFVGSYIGAYVDKKNENRIITYWQNEKKTKIYTAKRNEYENFEETQITYRNSNSCKRIKINEQIPFIYNNVYYGNYNKEIAENIMQNTDCFTVIDNDGDGKGDIVKAVKYTHYLVKSVSPMKESIIFKNDGGVLDITDKTTAEFVFNGQSIDPFKDLKANDVLTVLEGVRIDKSRVFCANVTRDLVNGKITSIGETDWGKYYIIDGTYYYLSDDFIEYMNKNSSQKKPVTGSMVQLYIGADGRVVGSKSEDDFSYGFVMASSWDESEEIAKIKIYTVDGTEKSYFMADKVTIYNKDNQNGRKFEKEAAYRSISTEGKLNNEAIAYTLNSDNMISSLAVALDRTAYQPGTFYYPLTLDYYYEPQGPTDQMARMYRNVLARTYTMNNLTPILTVPKDESLLNDVKAYQIKSGSSWSTENYFQPGEIIRAYNCDKFYNPEFYVINGTTSTTISQTDGKVHIYAIEKIGNSLDDEDNPVKTISYYDNKEFKTTALADDVIFVDEGIFCDVKTVDDLKTGDIIQFEKDVLGKINVIRVVFRINDGLSKKYGLYKSIKETETSYKLDYTADLLSTMPELAVIYGVVEDIEGTRALIKTDSDKKFYPVTLGGSVYGSVYYTIYDTKGHKISPGTISELQSGDIVIMRRYYNHVQDVIIIR